MEEGLGSSLRFFCMIDGREMGDSGIRIGVGSFSLGFSFELSVVDLRFLAVPTR
jgi:hypothetical protein